MLVSVIIPAYNCEKYIEETIRSVYLQTTKDFELIVVDDGSTDYTQAIVKRNLMLPHRLITQKNQGEAAARNTGLKNAIGKYIAFLDCDDLYHYEKLKYCIEFLEKNRDYGMVYGNYAYLIEPDKFTNWKNWDFSFSNNGSGDIFIKQFIENNINILTTLVRRECFEKVGLFDESIPYASDSDMWIRISAYYKIGYINKCMGYYRLHNTNVSIDRETCLLHRIASINKNYQAFYERVKGNKEIIKSIRNLYYRLIKLYIKKKEYKKALYYFWDYRKRYKNEL